MPLQSPCRINPEGSSSIGPINMGCNIIGSCWSSNIPVKFRLYLYLAFDYGCFQPPGRVGGGKTVHHAHTFTYLSLLSRTVWYGPVHALRVVNFEADLRYVARQLYVVYPWSIS